MTEPRSLPTISVITVTRDCASTLSACLGSIAGQTYPVEHIIVDGCSTDDTLQVVESHGSHVSAVVCGPDRGVYDAMNKGLELATGEVVGFLNADDRYAHERVLERIASAMSDPAVDSCYGDLVYVDAEDPSRTVRYWKSGPFSRERFYNGWMPPHPTFFARKSVYERFGGFNVGLGTSADYEFMLRCLFKHRITATYIPEVLVIMRTGGLSNSSLIGRIRANRCDRDAWRVNDLQPRPWTLLAKPLCKVSQYWCRGRS